MKNNLLLALSAALISSALNAAPAPVVMNGLPMTIEHVTQPGTSNVKSLSLVQLNKIDASWNVICNYKTTEINNGVYPLIVQLSGSFYGNYNPRVVVDGKAPLYWGSDELQVEFYQPSGVIELNGMYVLGMQDASMNFRNVDGSGDLTLTNCTAVYNQE